MTPELFQKTVEELTLDELERWVRALPKGHKFFMGAASCPVAEYLKQFIGDYDTVLVAFKRAKWVTGEIVKYDNTYINLPQDIWKFVYEVDNIKPDMRHYILPTTVLKAIQRTRGKLVENRPQA